MKLPRRFIDTATLEHMRVGDVRYTTPWAMWVDIDMECWLHPGYTADMHPGGTVQMRVERTRKGYAVRVPHGENYTPCERQPFASPDDTQWIPVAAVS